MDRCADAWIHKHSHAFMLSQHSYAPWEMGPWAMGPWAMAPWPMGQWEMAPWTMGPWATLYALALSAEGG